MENASNKRNIVNGPHLPAQTPLSHDQKKALLVLAFFSLIILIFGFWRIRYQIYSPFDYEKIIAAAGNDTVETENLDYNLDTDKDGISDYEESEIYNTSPYLEDSDSDGFKDKDEILHGTDPNCPAGQVCQEVLDTTIASTTTGTTSELLDLLEIDTEEAGGADPLESMLSGQSDAATLRQLLIENGMDKDTLDKISDADLLKSYQESLQDTNQE